MPVKKLPLVLVTGNVPREEVDKQFAFFSKAQESEVKDWAKERGFIYCVLERGSCILDPDAVGLAALQTNRELMEVLRSGRSSRPLLEMGEVGRRFINSWGPNLAKEGFDLTKAQGGVNLNLVVFLEGEGERALPHEIPLELDGKPSSKPSALKRSGQEAAFAPNGTALTASSSSNLFVTIYNVNKESERARLRAATFVEAARLLRELEAENDLLLSQVLAKVSSDARRAYERVKFSGSTVLSDFPDSERGLILAALSQRGVDTSDMTKIRVKAVCFEAGIYVVTRETSYGSDTVGHRFRLSP